MAASVGDALLFLEAALEPKGPVDGTDLVETKTSRRSDSVDGARIGPSSE